MRIFSIKNEKLNFFNRPIYCESSNEALVYLTNVLSSDADRALYHLKDDLALYEIGDIDFVTGYITPISPQKICDLNDIFNQIPSECIPRTEKQIMSVVDGLRSRIDILDNAFKNIDSILNSRGVKRWLEKIK